MTFSHLVTADINSQFVLYFPPQTSREIKVSGAIGPCVSLGAKGPSVSENVCNTFHYFSVVPEPILPFHLTFLKLSLTVKGAVCLCSYQIITCATLHVDLYMVVLHRRSGMEEPVSGRCVAWIP